MRRILKAVLSMGLSSAVTLLLSALRAKVLAVELGATGVGILGIVSTSVLLAATFLGAGLGASGVRAVAAAPDGDERRDIASVAVARGSALLALLATPLVWVGWEAKGQLIVPEMPSSVLAPWVGVAVGATIGMAGTSALLNGVSRIGALATSTALGSVFGTAVFLVAMQLSNHWGLIAAFVAVPVATLVVGVVMVRSTYPRGRRVSGGPWVPALRGMLVLGLAVSSSVILTNATQVIARVRVSRTLGIVDAGYLQACLAIGAVYLGFVLTALAAEYYPRISALAEDREQLNRTANDQMRIVLLLGGPAIVWMIAATPLLLHLLYSSDFAVAHALLRLLLVGDVFKLVGWCVGFVLLAREAKLKFFLAELSWNVFFLAILVPLAGRGLAVAGLAYLTAYLLYTIVTLLLVRRETGFVMAATSRRTVAWTLLAVLVTFAAAETQSPFHVGIMLLTAVSCTFLAARSILALIRVERPADGWNVLPVRWLRR